MSIDAAPPRADTAALLRPAVALLASDPARAEAAARAALAIAPEDADALVVLGTALRLQGSFAAAKRVLQPFAAGPALSWIAQFELAQVLLALGETRAAVEPLRRAVALHPGLSAAWRLLGDIALVSGRLQEAQCDYDRALAASLRDPALKGPAQDLLEGRLDASERELRRLLDRQPTPLALHLLGEILRRSRPGEAAGLLARCLEAAPEFGAARQSHALALFGAGRCVEALAQLDRLLVRSPADQRARITRAAVLTEIGDYAAAAEVTAELLAVFPDQPHAWLAHGAGLRTLGRIEEATAAWRRCLGLDPECSEAWWSLANLKTLRFNTAERAAMEARLARPELAIEHRVNLHFALAKAREDAGDFAVAFGHYARGNALEHARRPYDPTATTATVRSCKALFTPDFFAARAAWGWGAPDPIFIVGLPRSGSTLVDQVLASHPAIEGLQELHDIQLIADFIGGPPVDGRRPCYPDRLADLSAERCRKLGAQYVDWTSPRRRLGRRRFTDKAPWNFAHLGLIRLILPEAKIVDVRRHPMACCFSAFAQHFSDGWSFAYDLADLGAYYADYLALMTHFDTVLTGAIHRVIYEDLIADPEREMRRLLAFLDLPFDPACLRFFDNPRPVATPSSQQVRRPIHAGGLDHWRNFEPWLHPLKTALGTALEDWRSGGRG